MPSRVGTASLGGAGRPCTTGWGIVYVIGLTGNIATGKSMVASMLAHLGAYVIDADQLAHSVMRSGKAVHGRIVERFGRGILDALGEIDRGVLGEIVFADPKALFDLERIVHPEVVRETLRLLYDTREAVGVVEAIKLFEADMHHHCDVVWVVTSSRDQQVERLMTSRQLTRDQALLRVDAQPRAVEKAQRADQLIDNSGTLDGTWKQVRCAWLRIPGAPRVPNKPWVPAPDRVENG